MSEISDFGEVVVDESSAESPAVPVERGGRLWCPSCKGMLNRHFPSRCPECLQRLAEMEPAGHVSDRGSERRGGEMMSEFLPGIEAPNGILSYGGGRQTVAICALVLEGRLLRPDRIVIADTGRENPMTWDYLRDVTGPAMEAAGMRIEVVGRDQPPDVYGGATLILPVYTPTGKFRPMCSGTWKRDAMDQYLRQRHGITGGVKWIGFSADEKRRLKDDPTRGNWTFRYPLVELGITSDGCRELIAAHGWPQPHRSSCWMCPNKKDDEWEYIRDNYPELWAEACAIDKECRENDDSGGVWLHKSRKPLCEALGQQEPEEVDPRCETGMCFV